MIRARDSGTRSGSGAGGAWRIAPLNSNPVAPRNGFSPLAISYSSTPSDQMSLRSSAGSPRRISGAITDNVPAMTPSAVSDARDCDRSSSVPRDKARASPKSSTFALPSRVIKTFALFRSRCVTPPRCACASASAICVP